MLIGYASYFILTDLKLKLNHYFYSLSRLAVDVSCHRVVQTNMIHQLNACIRLSHWISNAIHSIFIFTTLSMSKANFHTFGGYYCMMLCLVVLQISSSYSPVSNPCRPWICTNEEPAFAIKPVKDESENRGTCTPVFCKWYFLNDTIRNIPNKMHLLHV